MREAQPTAYDFGLSDENGGFPQPYSRAGAYVIGRMSEGNAPGYIVPGGGREPYTRFGSLGRDGDGPCYGYRDELHLQEAQKEYDGLVLATDAELDPRWFLRGALLAFMRAGPLAPLYRLLRLNQCRKPPNQRGANG